MKNKLLCLFLCLLLTATCVSCHAERKDEPSTTSTVQQEPLVVDNSSANALKDPSELAEDQPSIVTPTLKTEIDADDAIDIQKQHWEKPAFMIGPHKYTLPFSYSRISKNWIFDPKEYGYEDGFSLKAGEKTSPTVELHHKVSDCTMIVGFYNPTKETIDIKDAKIWAFDFSVSDAKHYPKIKLPGGISWGSTIVDIVLAYGTPEIPVIYNKEMDYWEYSFKHDYNIYYRLIIDKKRGLRQFSYKNYNLTSTQN